MKQLKRSELKESCLYLLFAGAILATVAAFLFGMLWLTSNLAVLIGLPRWSSAAMLAVLGIWIAHSDRRK